jgi:hypothetical protein
MPLASPFLKKLFDEETSDETPYQFHNRGPGELNLHKRLAGNTDCWATPSALLSSRKKKIILSAPLYYFVSQSVDLFFLGSRICRAIRGLFMAI